MSVIVGLGSATVLLALVGPRGRALRRAAGDAHAGAGRPARGADLAAVLVAAGAELRAGRSPADAWTAALGTPTGAVPDVRDLLAACAPADRPRSRDRGLDSGPGRQRGGGLPSRPRAPRRARDPHLLARATAVVAATRTAEELGAPLATMLDRVAESIAQDVEARDEVDAALAGPRATARVLAGLPLLGLALAALLGADPFAVLLGGGLGTTAGVAGAVLLIVGRRWTARLIDGAQREVPRRRRPGPHR
ncbi:type II secretion system F family protein [Cellulomonas sp. DKR-3]|uniref:Type II secretion system F family protein n=1 Tax=Cellulomonas fulva TaxID=2835530 RepID=A0ABS5TYB6_9CELL|nr:type II secretion system F family protein [Cellulomonas fulva]MBT0994151.1 type II secretion system F family protein [Cellulomonas fulva]